MLCRLCMHAFAARQLAALRGQQQAGWKAAGGSLSSPLRKTSRTYATQSDVEPQTTGVLSRRLDVLAGRASRVQQVIDFPAKKARLQDLEQRSTAADFWEKAADAQKVLQVMSDLKSQLEQASRIDSLLSDAQTAIELLQSESGTDADMLEEAGAGVRLLERELDAWELQRLLDMPYASNGAILTITAGAGGTDAQDWAEMLMRMYERWSSAQGFTTKVLEVSEGDEAGIKSATLEMQGRYAYGYLLSEKGTHRLVRMSPFNAKGARQTSFTGIEVMPLLGDGAVNVALPEEDLDISFTRSGGKGGQNVNKVETAVRIRHIPTGIAVKCTQERSQARNKDRALEILKAKLLIIAEEQRAADIAGIRGDKVKAEWGQQIRNYVLHPYKLVKDLRTGVETADTEGVLNGDLKPFIDSFLRHRAEGSLAAVTEATDD